MAIKNGLRQDDFNRVILTELVPYEIPIRFSFHHFYELYTKKSPLKYVKALFFNSRKWQGHDFIPFSYSIKGNGAKTRNLGLIHPLLFEPYVDFYRRHSELISSLCKKSPWSLRAPKRTAKTYYKSGDHVYEGTEEDEPEILDKSFSSNFFLNQKYNFLYKFYESKELIELESKFQKCFRTDVSNCFGNIYTHSICWAIHTKSVAKSRAHRASKTTFDSEFDLLARRSNHGETHGILIGAEVSRIFAEIIFQEIDARLLGVLEAANLIRGEQYEIRRYIDDFFIFFNEDKIKNSVSEELVKILESYKLYINESKNIEWQRPFVTSLSIVKGRLTRIINEEVGFYVQGQEKGHHSLKSSSPFIKKLRLTLSEHSVPYSECSSYLLKEVYRRIGLSCPIQNLDDGDLEGYCRWLEALIEITFFVFNADARFQISITVGKIILDVQRCIQFLPNTHSENLQDLLLAESVKLLHRFSNTEGFDSVELASFIISLKSVRGSKNIASRLLEQLFLPRENQSESPCYFSIIAILYFCDEFPQYEFLRGSIADIAVRKILSVDELIDHTEGFCMALDLLSCPYFESVRKDVVARKLLDSMSIPSDDAQEVARAIGEFSRSSWLFDWRENIDTEAYFKKKELSFAY